ncbi:MAG: T9SS type A sorting domain-containing protein [Melioribacteraceae bacterium]|nr:T9SS type A sorting domain-containing protein [Melioribacteraceae bacterium]
MKKTFYLILFCTSTLFAQIDSTDWYPLHVGDKWEYYYPNEYYTVEIIGDTLMPNGHKYYIVNGGVSAWKYQRVENNSKVFYYVAPHEKEYLLFDFKLEEKSIWKVPFSAYYWGLNRIWISNDNIMGVYLENREFEFVKIDSAVSPPDTVWNHILEVYPTLVTKHIGISTYGYGLEELVGAYINGVGYGTLVKVDEEELGTPNEFRLSQNYPNPFNPSTTIEYTIPNVETLRATSQMQNVTLKVFDILGREVAELVNEQKPAGRYRVNFNGAALPSGVYIYQLSTGSQLISRKMMLIK